MLGRLAGLAAVALAIGLAAAAQDAGRVEEVRFAPGEEAATVQGSISGLAPVEHRLAAGAGQTLKVAMQAENAGVYFDVVPPDRMQPLHAGARQGRSFEGELPVDGAYAVAVFLDRAAARRNEIAAYTLAVELSGEVAAAEGDAGWRIAGVPEGGELELRARPQPAATVAARLPAGAAVRRLACEEADGVRWCQVTAAADPEAAGWVPEENLAEDAPEAAVPEEPAPAAARLPALATGMLDCGLVGTPIAPCRFEATRTGPASASVVVTMPDGIERTLRFGVGNVTTSDGATVATERTAGGTRVTVDGGAAVFVVPDAVLRGR